ncbi:hypothetical protein BG004_006019 [Podila humilis]|nr:hypothetical protein BG004_006019 [Podila humilis]
MFQIESMDMDMKKDRDFVVTMSPRANLVNIPPEVLELIFSYLPPATLALCSRVSSDLYKAVIPSMWGRVNISNPKSLSNLLSDSGLNGLSKNAAYIHELTIVSTDMLHLFVPVSFPAPTITSCNTFRIDNKKSHELSKTINHHPVLVCTDFRRLVISCFMQGQSNFLHASEYNQLALMEEEQVGILKVIQRNSDLVSLRICNSMSLTTAMTIIHNITPTLCDIEIRTKVSPKAAAFILSILPAHIRAFSLYGIHDARIYDPSYGASPAVERELEQQLEQQLFVQQLEQNQGNSVINHEALKSLELFGRFSGSEETVMLPFLYSCHRLHHFRTSNILCFRNPTLHRALASLDIYLQHVTRACLPNEEETPDHGIGSTLMLSDRLLTVDLYRCRAVGPRTIKGLLNSADTLVRINLNCHGLFTSQDLVSLFTQCKSLVAFSTTIAGFRCDQTEIVGLSSNELVGLDWGSPLIEELGLVITVPRPNEHVPSDRRSEPLSNGTTLTYSREIQRQVYLQLGRQVNLKALDLGAMYGASQSLKRQWYSLEMSLTSGLDELAGLKCLERLNVHQMNHSIGVKELEWMKVHWPHLRVINGFWTDPKGKGRDFLRPEIVKWMDENPKIDIMAY